MKISRRPLADYVKTLHQKACRTCSTIIFLHSTNQIIDLWRCRWRCRRQTLSSLLTQEKPFHLVWASSKTTKMCMARSHSNTIQMILLPSHTTRCACLCINSSSAKRITCCNYTINIFTPHATLKLVTSFYCSVISIITVTCWASSSADFFPLFRSPSIFRINLRCKGRIRCWFIWRVVFPYLVSHAKRLLTYISVSTCKT